MKVYNHGGLCPPIFYAVGIGFMYSLAKGLTL